MASAPARSEPPPPSLRDARRDFVRRHLCEAARDLFYRQGYAATTFEQIANAAGTKRTTLYTHFADKAEILAAIAQDYHARLLEIVEELPAPRPSRAEIDIWIERLVAFVAAERVPATVMIGLGVGHDTPPVVETLSDTFGAAIAARMPAFAASAGPRADRGRRAAEVKVILRELSLGSLEAAAGREEGRAVLAVVGDLIERMLSRDD